MLSCYGAIMTRSKPIFWAHCFTSNRACETALYRLNKKGLIIQSRGGGKAPFISLAKPLDKEKWINPETLWNQKWRSIWSVLIYDVPEQERGYRDTLRDFLKSLRMGQLQKSVWISPRDIRPEYDDLRMTINIDGYAYLFEAKTVLGRRSNELVHKAWDFDRLFREYTWYIETCAYYMDQIQNQHKEREELERIAEEEMTTYRAILEHDPLLPHALLPYTYRGREAYAAHREFITILKKAFRHN